MRKGGNGGQSPKAFGYPHASIGDNEWLYDEQGRQREVARAQLK